MKQEQQQLPAKCLKHNEIYTNMCVEINCLKPLCPECIDQHLKDHRDHKDHKDNHKKCQIDSIKQCRSSCQKKTKIAYQQLTEIMNQEEIQVLNQPQKYIERIAEILNEKRNELIQIIDSSFSQIMQEIKYKLSQTFQDSQLKEMSGRIQHLLMQLQQLTHQLEAQNGKENEFTIPQYETMKSVCLLNTTSLIQNCQTETTKEINKLQFPILMIEGDIEQEMRRILKLINVQNKLYLQVQLSSLISHKPLINSKLDIPFQITMDDYYLKTCVNRFLHFFRFNSKELHLYSLEEPQPQQKINLNINFKIPIFHTSLTNRQGKIYLIGGSLSDSSFPKNKSQIIYQYEPVEQTLIEVGQLIRGRSSHFSLLVDDYIYTIGGVVTNSIQEKSFERYNCITKQSELLQDCQYACVASLCVHYNDYIYKFGGLLNHQRLNCIERYSLREQIWENIDPDIYESQAQLFHGFNQFSAGCQISENTIFIFGGYDFQGNGLNQSFLFKITNDSHLIHMIDEHPLRKGGAFYQQQCIINKKTLYALENIEDENGDVRQDQKLKLIFTNGQWS